MSDTDAEAQALRNTPFFSGLTDEDISHIVGVGEQVRFEAGASIFEQGAVGDAMFVLLEGQAEVDVGGRFHKLKPGTFFGEMALFSAGTRLATVKTTEPVRALRIPADGFQAVLLAHPRVALSMLKAMSERLREVEQRVDAWMG
ncbi:MAG: cyclic nucleotide-binding domain-containing protein [Actinomycetota bacterium]